MSPCAVVVEQMLYFEAEKNNREKVEKYREFCPGRILATLF